MKRKYKIVTPYLLLGALHKGHPHSGGSVQCGHLADKGVSSDADVRIFGAKNSEYFKIYGVPARKTGEGEGSIFRNFVQTSFVDSPFLDSIILFSLIKLNNY